MGDGLTRELPAAQPRWRRDRRWGGITSHDGRFNMRRGCGMRPYVAVYSIHRDEAGAAVLVLEGIYSNMDRAIRRVHALRTEQDTEEARMQYDRDMLWMFRGTYRPGW